MFERFHRVETSKCRSYEGTVSVWPNHELVKLHGGSIKSQAKKAKEHVLCFYSFGLGAFAWLRKLAKAENRFPGKQYIGSRL